MSEIGSFIELQFEKGKEFYNQQSDIARLNSGRAAIWHALRVTGCNTIWLPYYQCDTVKDFLYKKNVSIKFYYIDDFFNPKNLSPKQDEAVLIVNYYGVMSRDRMSKLASFYNNVIIDNSQAFYCLPLNNCINVYSCRKFIGVPDGSYVIGRGADKYIKEYTQGYSSDTSLFLLQRIEFGCEGKSYKSRMLNEHRIDTEDICKMSVLTHKILDGTDYEMIRVKRRENFDYVASVLNDINLLDAEKYYDENCVPMVYPLVVEDESLLDKLVKAKHFQGHWWSYLLNELPENVFEYKLSKYIIPITIDQRYNRENLDTVLRVIKNI